MGRTQRERGGCRVVRSQGPLSGGRASKDPSNAVAKMMTETGLHLLAEPSVFCKISVLVSMYSSF